MPLTPENISIALTDADWRLLYFLVGRGAKETLDLYVEKGLHDLKCVEGAVQVYGRLREALEQAGILEPQLPSRKTTDTQTAE
jgi:hypothetical protein